MTHSPLVSVVMAAYNEEKFIGEAIKSILDQTYTNFEFIIVNDGSTDATENVILSFKDSRIHYIRNVQNLKLIDSLNIGLKVAKGKYIARMDSDDISLPARLEKQVAFMESNPEIGISGALLEVFGKESGIMRYPLTHKEIELNLLITSCFGNNVVIFRRELLEKHDLYFPKGYLHAEDYKSWTNWTHCAQLANQNEVLVRYRSHDASISVANRNIQRETRNRIRKEYLMKVFGSSESLADSFVGPITFKRISAAKQVLEINRQNQKFKEDDLRATVFTLWYLDSLEKIEQDPFIIFKFPYVFTLALRGNFKRWWFLMKHYLKLKLIRR